VSTPAPPPCRARRDECPGTRLFSPAFPGSGSLPCRAPIFRGASLFKENTLVIRGKAQVLVSR